MRIQRRDLSNCATADGAVVVIDVLRSFTTAAYALAQGATEVVVVESVDAARRWRERDPRVVTAGALGGGAPAPGLHLGNSPSQLGSRDLRGRRLILNTAGGTRGLLACSHRGGPLLAASLVCASATAMRLRALAPAVVTLVVTGGWTDRDGDEDQACADLIEALLRGDDPPRAPFEARVRASDFGRRFDAGDDPHLPPADLACCAQADRFAFAMEVRPLSGQCLVLRRTGTAAHALHGERAD